MNNKQTLAPMVTAWGLSLKKVHDNLEIAGSPERSLERVVVEDKNHKRYLLEKISAGELPRKRQIAETLTLLKERGVSLIHPYLKSSENTFHPPCGDGFCQLSPYIEGRPLTRPQYTLESWRGEALARFLIEFYQKAEEAPLPAGGDLFSITAYIQKISDEIKAHNPEFSERIAPVLHCLNREFVKGHDTIPVRFCHGDFHVLNVIWSESGINGVIDWEFCGRKPEIYDVANMLGCIGIEDPNALSGPLATSFLQTLSEAGVISKEGWRWLGEFIIALRFAWLAEWLRRNDHPMIELELTYMNLLASHIDTLFR